MTMRYSGTNIIEHEGQKLIRIRNHTTTFVVVTQNLLDFLGDLRYVSVFMDFADGVWVRSPTGKQRPLPRPYTLAILTPKNVLDTRIVQV